MKKSTKINKYTLCTQRNFKACFLISTVCCIFALKNTVYFIKYLKYIFITVAVLIGVISTLILSLQFDAVQRRIAGYVSKEIRSKYNIPVSIEKINIKNFKELALENVLICSHDGDTIIASNRAMASISPRELADGNLHINTVVFAAPDIRLSRDSVDAPLNIQFIINSLNKKRDDGKSPSLSINQLIVYDGKFSYDILDEPCKEQRFDPNHIAIEDFRCNLSLKNFNKENLNISIRSISGRENSGLEITRLKTQLFKQKTHISFRNLSLELPNSIITAGNVDIHNIYIKDSLRISGDISSEAFTFKDIAPFVPKAIAELPEIAFSIKGNTDSTNGGGDITLSSTDSGIGIKMHANIRHPYSENRFIDLNIDSISVKEKALEHILSTFSIDTMNISQKLGDTFISGHTSFSKDSLAANAIMECKSGDIKAIFDINKEGHYSIQATGTGVNLENLVAYEPLKECNFTLSSKGNIHGEGNYAAFDAEIGSLLFKGHRYTPIKARGNINRQQAKINISTKGENLDVNAQIAFQNRQKTIAEANIEVAAFNPHALNLCEAFPQDTFSFSLESKYAQGKELKIEFDNFVHANSTGKEKVKKFFISDNITNGQHNISLHSDFINGNIVGVLNYNELINSFLYPLGKHLPTAGVRKKKSKNNYIFNIELKNTEYLSRLFDLPLNINETSHINGTCNDLSNTLSFNASLNNITFKESNFRSIEVNGEANADSLHISTSIFKPVIKNRNTYNYSDTINDLAINTFTTIRNDSITNTFKWRNRSNDGKIKGGLTFSTALSRNRNGKLSQHSMIHPGTIIHNGNLWRISTGEIKGGLERMQIRGINIYNNTQNLRIEGIIGKNATDELYAYTKNVSVAAIMGLANFKALLFDGRATGKAVITKALTAPEANGSFTIENFEIDGEPVGRGDLDIEWNNDEKAIILDCDLHNNDTLSHIHGFISQAQDSILIRVKANKLNVGLIGKKVSGYVADLKGTADGDLDVVGTWRNVDLSGRLLIDGSTRVKVTNTTYKLDKGYVDFAPGVIKFDNIPLKDRKGNGGMLSGIIGHNHFSNWTCDLDIAVNDMIVYDTSDYGSMPFYGTVYAKGHADIIYEPKDGFKLKANVQSSPGSLFVYNSTSASGARDNSFVNFIDSSKKRQRRQTAHEKEKNRFIALNSRLNLDFYIDINEGFRLKVMTNTQTDDYIDLYGKGLINAIYDEKEGFSMNGTLNLERGTYKFTIQDLMPKEFNIQKGSSLTFDGDPFEAELDLRTKHLVPSVSLSGLTTQTSKIKNVKVNCIMNITGTLAAPRLEFDIELPEAHEDDRELLASVASTPEQKNTQFVYLLAVGSFYTFDYNDETGGETSSTAMESFISNTLSGQLSNMLGRIIDNDNWDISGNFSSGEKGWNRMEVEGMLQGRLLNDRLLINGNLGYRDNPIANSSFIGDFEIQWRPWQSTDFYFKAYSRTNDRYFSDTNLTTQGAGGLYKFDFDRWLFWKKKRKARKIENAADAEEDKEKETIKEEKE